MPLKFSKQHLAHALPPPQNVTVFERTISLLEKLRFLAAFMAFYLVYRQCNLSWDLQATAMRSSQAAAHLRTYRVISYSIMAWLVSGAVLHVFWMAWRYLPRFWESRRSKWNDYRAKMVRALKNLESRDENKSSIQDEEREILNGYEKELRNERFLEIGSNALLLSVGFAVCMALNQMWFSIRSHITVPETAEEESPIPVEPYTFAVYYVPGLLPAFLNLLSIISFVLCLRAY